MELKSLASYQRDGKRLAQIVGVLARYGFAERLNKIEPGFMRKWMGHENLEELAAAPLARRAKLACEELGPAFIKLGQILSTRPDIVSSEVAGELESLQADTPPSPRAEVLQLVESEIGIPIAEAFAEFDPEPLASASIGQVHRARLHSGRHVVVKVQHPGIEDRVHVDLGILVHLCRFLEAHDADMRTYGLVAFAEDARRTVLRELDFRRELRNQQAFERNFADNPDVRIPSTIAHLSNRRVLTMDFVSGYSIREHDRMAADGHDTEALAQAGADAFLAMLFRDSLFHADPHPGNVFVQPDGRLVLLDFGMVGRLDDDLREDLLDLVLSFVGRDTAGIARAVERLGSVPPEVDSQALRRDLGELQAEVSETPIAELDVAQLLDEFTTLVRTHRVRLLAPVAMLIKVVVMLDGTSRSLDSRFSLIELLQPYCKRALRRRHAPREQMRRVIDYGRDWNRLLGRLPSTLDDLLHRVQTQNFRIDMEHRGLQAAVDRLVSGTLCSALLLGGTLMWALAAPPTLWGVSVLGFLATATATLHGVRLLMKLGRR